MGGTLAQLIRQAGYLGQDLEEDVESLTGDPVLTSTFLKLLHGLLVKLYSSEFLPQDKYGGRSSVCVSNQWLVEIKYTDIIVLSKLLYDKLHEQFEWLIFGTSHSVLVPDENGSLTADAKFSPVEFLLLLRCSMIILKFLEFDRTLVLDRCQLLVILLEKLCPNSLLQFCHVDAITSEAGMLANFSSSILEAFLDEFLLRRDLRKYFITTYCSLATKKNSFVSTIPGDVQVITEFVSFHFLRAVNDEPFFDRFLSSLFWSNEGRDQIPALSLGSSLVLLSDPVIFSAPHLMRAHVILLASRGIGISMPTDAKKSDELQMRHYILAFKLSVELYSGIIPYLNLFTCIHRNESESRLGAEGPVFNSCVRSLTHDMLTQQIDKLIDLCHLPSYGLHSRTRAEILDNSIAYIKDNQNLFGETFRDEACSILSCMVKVMLSREGELLHEDKVRVHQEMCFVAAVLKLMSSALLQVVWYMVQRGSSGEMSNAKQPLLCKEYEFMSEIIRSFRNYGGNQHIQKILFSAIESSTGRQHDIKLMFSHFASLLSYSFTKRVDFLWKGCIFMMIPLINLLAIEEENLDAFHPSLRKIEDYSCLHTSQDLFHEPSSVTIAAEIKKVRDQTECRQHEDSSTGNREISRAGTPDGMSNASKALQIICADNTCAADIFFKHLRGFESKRVEWEDLDDFVECNPRKDYSDWLEKRRKFRNWKFRKLKIKKHDIKKNMLRSRGGLNFAKFRLKS